MRVSGWTHGLLVLGLVGVLIAGVAPSFAEAGVDNTRSSAAIADPIEAAREMVDGMRKAFVEAFNGDPRMADQIFASRMKELEKDFAATKHAMDKASEKDQRAYALEYLEESLRWYKERITWLQRRITRESNPRWKEILEQALKEQQAYYPRFEENYRAGKLELSRGDER
jgi:hypothetical protein